MSPLEFAAWAGDVTDPDEENNFGMVNMLLKYVTNEQTEDVLKQLQGVRNQGTEYGLFLAPFHSLIRTYQDYDDCFDKLENWFNRSHYFVTQIGRKQYELPIVGLQWFCDDEPFHPTPAFNRAPNRSLTIASFYNHIQSLDALDASGLGNKVYISKWATKSCLSASAVPSRGVGALLALVIEKLCEISAANLDKQIFALQQKIEADIPFQLKK